MTPSPARSPLRPQTNQFRQACDLSGVWLFRPGDADAADAADGGDSGGEPDWAGALPIGVPGSWNDQVPGLRDELGPVWYQRRFEAPPGVLPLAARDAAIRFGSACYAAEAWLNGKPIGGHVGGHLPFALDCSDALRDGENVLTVRVDGRLSRDQVPPGLVPPAHTHGRVFHPDVSYDYFPYAGIHRRVELVVTPADGIRDVRLATTPGGEDGAYLSVIVEAGDGDLALLLDGDPITSPHRVARRELWSPASPRLHRLEVELRRDGELVDRYVLRTGIRTVAVAGEQLLLNGEPVQLRGFSRHEDFPVLGRGTASALNARDLLLMRHTGANSFRTSHYPCDEETLDIADQLGLMVIAETPAVGLYFHEDEHLARRQQQSLRSLDELIARDRNRACVIAWSVANEPRMNYPAAASALGELCDAARALDGTRPVGYATDLPQAAGVGASDVVFLNAYPAWYRDPGRLETAGPAIADALDRLHQEYGKPIVITEFGADALPGSHADPPAMWTEEYQAELIESILHVAGERAFVVGTHIWAFADFSTAQADHRPASVNFKGVFTRDRQPKLAARRLRQLWSS